MKKEHIEAVARELVGDPPAPPKVKELPWMPARRTVEERGLVVKTLLADQISDTPSELEVHVEFRNGSIFLYPKGYGDYCSEDGHGCPAVIELAEGKLRIVAWTDINIEDSTTIVELDGAREGLRTKDDPAELDDGFVDNNPDGM